MAYVLIEWPDVQALMEMEGFEENSSLADCEEFGSSAYFVDEDWLKEVEGGEDDSELDALNKEYEKLESRYADGYGGGWDDEECENWMEDAINLLSRFKDYANKK